MDYVEYIKEFNEISNITIEYAVLEPITLPSGEPSNNLHFVYTPKINCLLNNYVSGIYSDVIDETILQGEYITLELSKFLSIELSAKWNPIIKDTFKKINKVVMSNIARFCNFKFNSSTDPFLSMFLEEKNIIWKTKEFDNFFFSQKALYKPTQLFTSKSVLAYLADVNKKANEYLHSYGGSDKIAALYNELPNIVSLYFITLNYLKTGEFSSKFSETEELILNTLQQSTVPWDYLKECARTLAIEQGLTQGLTQGNCKELLKTQALSFLHYRFCEEANRIYHP